MAAGDAAEAWETDAEDSTEASEAEMEDATEDCDAADEESTEGSFAEFVEAAVVAGTGITVVPEELVMVVDVKLLSEPVDTGTMVTLELDAVLEVVVAEVELRVPAEPTLV